MVPFVAVNFLRRHDDVIVVIIVVVVIIIVIVPFRPIPDLARFSSSFLPTGHPPLVRVSLIVRISPIR